MPKVSFKNPLKNFMYKFIYLCNKKDENINRVTNIVMILDETYLMCSLCAIYSLKKHKKKKSIYNLYLLVNNVSACTKKILNKLSAENFEVTIIEANVEKYRNIPNIHHITNTALIKFNIPSILKNLDKVLYIDGDIIVRKDLTDFYNMDISDYYLAGVRELRAEKKFGFHKLVNQKYYINSGVMLMNLAYLRLDDVENLLIETKLNQPKEWKCMDQDVFNYVCGGKIKFLGVEYNNPCMIFVASENTIEEINLFYGTKYKTINDLCDNSFILHYAGPNKPWVYDVPYHSKLYSKYLLGCKVPFFEVLRTIDKFYYCSESKDKAHIVITILGFIRIKIRRSVLCPKSV